MPTPVPSSKITIRQPKVLKHKVAQAAAMRGMTVTSFINGVLERVADRTIERVRRRELSDESSRALMALLAKPPGTNDALAAAARRYAERFGAR